MELRWINLLDFATVTKSCCMVWHFWNVLRTGETSAQHVKTGQTAHTAQTGRCLEGQCFLQLFVKNCSRCFVECKMSSEHSAILWVLARSQHWNLRQRERNAEFQELHAAIFSQRNSAQPWHPKRWIPVILLTLLLLTYSWMDFVSGVTDGKNKKIKTEPWTQEYVLLYLSRKWSDFFRFFWKLPLNRGLHSERSGNEGNHQSGRHCLQMLVQQESTVLVPEVNNSCGVCQQTSRKIIIHSAIDLFWC